MISAEDRFLGFIAREVMANRAKIEWAVEIAHFQAEELLEYVQTLDLSSIDLEEMKSSFMGYLLVTHLEGQWEERAARKLEKKWEVAAQRTQVRSQYCNAPEMHVRAIKAGTCSYRFDTSMACAGIIEQHLQHLGVKLNAPVVMNLLNKLPKILDSKGKETSQQHQVPVEEGQNFRDSGYELYQLKTVWNRSYPQIWEVMDACLPKAIDRSSYHRRLRAPLIPNGFMPETRVRFEKLAVNGQFLEADGSCIYDPDHPEMAGLMTQYGPVALQFTAFQEKTGHFMKGIMYPREGMNEGVPAEEQVAMQMDHLNVKGAQKSVHKKMDKENPYQRVFLDGVRVGFIKAKTRMGRVSGCFETLENIWVNPSHYALGANDPQYKADKIRAAKLILSLTRDSVDEIGKLGPAGLLGRATKDDLHLKRLGEFIAMANAQGAGIDPLSIPILESKMIESLRRKMWSPANGAGINGRYPMVIIDATLEPGTCVVEGYKAGTELACWRFPTILAQGLLVLKVVSSRKHHEYQGEITPNVIFMNPHDITTCQQGDDDGDEVGISTDPRIIELFRMKADRGIYHVEPTSEKLDHLASSPEGRSYLAIDPMGPVGPVTIMRAGLLAVGDTEMARAFSVLIQEAIDSQKNLVRMTSPDRASKLENWYRDRAGEYHIHYRCKGGECVCVERTGDVCPNEGQGYLTSNWENDRAGEFDIKLVRAVYQRSLISAGCSVPGKDGKPRAGWPLGWRNQTKLVEDEDGNKSEVKLSKSFALDNASPCLEKQDGSFKNYVHFAHDATLTRWRHWSESFKPTGTLPTKDILYTVMDKLGCALKPLNLTWNQYATGLRVRAGVEEYGAEMKKIKSAALQSEGDADGPVDEAARLAKIDSIRATLELHFSELSAQELITIWEMELTEAWWYLKQEELGEGKGRSYVTNLSEVPEGRRSWRANKPNYAFFAVTSKHSKVMEQLGMKATAVCSFMDAPKADKWAKWCRRQENPFLAMSKLVRENTSHHEAIHDENGQHIHIVDCPECCERVKTAVVRAIRADKSAGEQEAVKKLMTALNKAPHVQIKDLTAEEAEEVRDYEPYCGEDPFA